MKEVSLQASPRTATGKGAARQSRMAGNIPAVMYGPETAPQAIEVSLKDLRAAIKQTTSTVTIFDLQVGGKTNKVLIRDMQRDPITLNVTHIDFHAISMNKPIHITLPINFVGTPEGVKADGGILQTAMRELDIACLPKDIPETFDIDVSKLMVGDSIHVRDIEIPNATILSEEQRTIVIVQPPTVVSVPGTDADAAQGESALEEAEDDADSGDDKKEE